MKYEVAIQAEDYHDPKRAQVGDIITIRPARGTMGRKQLKHLIWITIDSPVDLNPIDFIKPVLDEKGQIIAKKRFSIGSNLSKLKAIMPSFDLSKAANANELYQPFLDLDEKLGKQRSKQDVPLVGLFQDKGTTLR